MTMEKLPSGSWRITQMVDGVRYRVTVDHRPSNAEAVRLMAKRMGKRRDASDMDVEAAMEKYLDSKRGVLSPTTMRGYRAMMRGIPADFMSRRIWQLTAEHVQTLAGTLSAGHSPKTVSNMMGFVMSVLKFHGVEIASPKLPQREKKTPYIPTEGEVSAIFDELSGNPRAIPVMLAALGFRRSEICALDYVPDPAAVPDGTRDIVADRKPGNPPWRWVGIEGNECIDLENNMIRITKALVQEEAGGRWVIKQCKTAESEREMSIPAGLSALIRRTGHVHRLHPDMIYESLTDVEKKLSIPHFPPHKLRHFFASYMHDRGFSDKQIQEAGGWKTSHVMSTVYQHAMRTAEAKRGMADQIGGLIPDAPA